LFSSDLEESARLYILRIYNQRFNFLKKWIFMKNYQYIRVLGLITYLQVLAVLGLFIIIITTNQVQFHLSQPIRFLFGTTVFNWLISICIVITIIIEAIKSFKSDNFKLYQFIITKVGFVGGYITLLFSSVSFIIFFGSFFLDGYLKPARYQESSFYFALLYIALELFVSRLNLAPQQPLPSNIDHQSIAAGNIIMGFIKRRMFSIILVVVLIVAARDSYYILTPIEAYAIKRGGSLERVVRNPGINFKIPFLEKGKKFKIVNYSFELKVGNKTFDAGYSINQKHYRRFYVAYRGYHHSLEDILEVTLNVLIKKHFSKSPSAELSTKDAEGLIQKSFNSVSELMVGERKHEEDSFFTLSKIRLQK
jgi:hypothetical protein